jgi:hypothetical protein
MAQPIRCDLCNENQAFFMVTAVGTGDVLAYCQWCVFPFAVAFTLNLPDGEAMMRAAMSPEPARPKRPRGKAKAPRGAVGPPEPVEEATDEPSDEDGPEGAESEVAHADA